MSIFDKLFGSGTRGSRGKGAADLEGALAALERRSEKAQPGHQGLPLNRAGDLCLESGQRDRALEYYGRAIDQLLQEGQPEAARGVANKIIRVHPEAIRTLCTLTWLDLSSHHIATALTHLREYVEAAKRGGREGLAREHILAMAKIVPDPEFVDAAADALDLMGFADAAGRVRDGTLEGMDPIRDRQELTRVCVNAAGGTKIPDDLRAPPE